MFNFFQTIVAKITSVIVTTLVTIGLVSTPTPSVQPATIANIKTVVEQKSKIIDIEERKSQKIKAAKKIKRERQRSAELKVETEKLKAQQETQRIARQIKFQKEEERKRKLEEQAKIQQAQTLRIRQEQEMKRQHQIEQQRVLDNIIRQQQEEQRIRQVEVLRRYQEELAQVQRANKLVDEYNGKINKIDQEILAIKQKYYSDSNSIKNETMPQGLVDGHLRKLVEDANWEIEKLQIQKESLRLEYLF